MTPTSTATATKEKPDKLKSHNYMQSAQVGKLAVEHIAWYYGCQGFDVVDVQDDVYYQAQDVDLLVRPHDARENDPWFTVEVKGQKYPPFSFFLETISNEKTNAPGCIVYTSAQVVVFYCIGYDVAFIIDVKALREWMGEHVEEHPYKRVFTRKRKEDTGGYSTGGHLVARSVLEKELPEGTIERIEVQSGLRDNLIAAFAPAPLMVVA